MLTRIITAIIALAAFFPVLYFSETITFPITMALLCVIGIYELYVCMGMLKCRIMFWLSLVCAAAVPVLARYFPNLVFAILVLEMLAALVISVLNHKKYAIDLLTFTAFEAMVVLAGFSLMVIVRDREPIRYLLIFVSAWTTDTFAYFSGLTFGRKKLCPEISPKKTIAGAVGGTIGCILSFIIFGIICNGLLDKNYSLIMLAAIAPFLSAAGQLGDLAASVVKRHYGKKDFGKMFPGHGGVLDRFDSILPITLLMFILTEISFIW